MSALVVVGLVAGLFAFVLIVGALSVTHDLHLRMGYLPLCDPDDDDDDDDDPESMRDG
jgi:hypothetical protein